MHIRTTRMEAFSDGVIGIIMTIMVFDIKFQDLAHDFNHTDVVNGLQILWPRIIAYFFSFLVLGTMWLNHHHMFHLVQIVDEKLIWLNLNLLFWMSLLPLPTNMIGKNPHLPESAAVYGSVLTMTGISFALLRHYVQRHKLMHQDDKALNKKVDKVNRRVQVKTIVGIVVYALSVPLAYVSEYISYSMLLVPTILFFIPDGLAEASDAVPEEDIDDRK